MQFPTNLHRSALVTVHVAAATALLALASCGPNLDPLTREGLWNATHANHDNLTLMVANPADLARGTGARSSDGQLAAAAVDRLRNDKLKKLPTADISSVASGSNDTSGSGTP